jgi:hypothetical protein
VREDEMLGRAVVAAVAALMTLAAACGGDGGDGGGGDARLPARDVEGSADRFAACARKSDYEVVRPKPPNERADFLHDEGFEFTEVDLEEPPLLFFSAIVDFFPSRSAATRARERIASSLAGPSTVRRGDVVVHYTDDPGTPRRTQVEKVVNGCLRG